MSRAFLLLLLVLACVVATGVLAQFAMVSRPRVGEKKTAPRPVTQPTNQVEAFRVSVWGNDLDHLEIRRLRRVRVPPIRDTGSSRYSVVVQARDGRELSRAPVRGGLACAVLSYGAVVAAPSEARRVLLFDGEREVERIEASESPPEFALLEPAVGTHDLDHLELIWNITDPDGDVATLGTYGLIGLGGRPRPSGKYPIQAPDALKGTFEAVASDGFWETRILRHYSIFPRTNQIVIADAD